MNRTVQFITLREFLVSITCLTLAAAPGLPPDRQISIAVDRPAVAGQVPASCKVPSCPVARDR